MKKLLYIGAGKDLDHLLSSEYNPEYSEYSEFVFVDSLPRNSYGYPYYYKHYYRDDFKKDVVEKLHQNGYEQTSEPHQFTHDFQEINVPDLDSHSVHFYNPSVEKHVRYLFSTSLPHESYDVFQNSIIPSLNELPDALFVRNHHPSEDVLKMLKKPFHFIGCFPTYFPKDVAEVKEDEKHTIYYSCMRHIISNTGNIVHKYTYIGQDGNCHHFSNYRDFYTEYDKEENRPIDHVSESEDESDGEFI